LPFLLLTTVMLAALAAPAEGTADDQPFSEARLNERAQHLARSPYVPERGALPKQLAQLSFDQYRGIRFRPDASVWRGGKELFQLQFFHLGHIYREPVSVYLVEGGRARAVRYARALFDYGANALTDPLPDTLGFAGLRVHFPLERKDTFDELVAFLGASYFRALGRGNSYGLSARGLAIDTAVASGEIFPRFREFYIERPAAGARRLVVHALLDSPSTTGAYRFDIVPGKNTSMAVTATLYPRLGAERLGIAPLTSMYFHGENDRIGTDDYRPEVHDSDGLLLWMGNGERLWRPLRNPDRLGVSVFRADALKGFGLLQRDRHPDHYQDLEATYERRPSVWVEPGQGFARGSVFLIEIPSREETNDNIVAFFTPDQGLRPGTPMRFTYRLLWGKAPEPPIAIAAAVATYTGSARQIGVPDAQQPLPPSARKLIVDFAPAPTPASADGVEAVVTASSGEVRNARVQVHPNIHGYRAVFDLIPKGTAPVELRCFLRRDGRALTETWTYRLERPAEEARR
jgi:periplasmic glucans biosynthesis protein